MRVVIAFCDLAGYTRFTEEEGEEEALSYVERFIEAVTDTLPDDARVVKTIGDEVMIVGQDVHALTDWAVGFQRLFAERPAPRIGIHQGPVLYRDGDYFGRDVNLASRVVARARGGEVLVTGLGRRRGARQPTHLEFENIGTVKLKGFDEPRTLLRAYSARTLMEERALEAARGERAHPRGASRCWCCSPGGRTRSACWTWRSGSGREVSALHVNYGLRAESDADEPPSAAVSASSWGCRWRVERASAATGGQPPGAGARRCATRSPSVTPRAATTPPATRPATRPRPCSTASRCRPGVARCSGMAARRGRLVRPLLEVDARGDSRVLPRARARMARGRLERRSPLRARACAK